MDLQASLVLTRSEVVLSFASLALLLVAAWRPSAGRLVSILAVVALVAAGAVTAGFLIADTDASAFGGLYANDAFANYCKLLFYGAAAVCLIIAPKFLEDAAAMRAEYPVLILLSCVGIGLMVSATDMMTLYIGLELNSLAAYVLASFVRSDGRSAEAGLKYFVLGALASGILLYGISLIYGFTGATNFAAIKAALSGELSLGLIFGIVFVLSGLAFKISAAPFHMWTPDVYEGAPTPVTTFFASAAKTGALALTIRITIEAFGSQQIVWQQIIIVVALMSIIVGAVGAIGQQNLKRLLAYSSINNVGFLLIGLATGTEQGVAAMLVYMAIYVVMTLGSFVFLMQLKDERGEQRETFADIAGLSKTRPGLALAMFVFMFSLAGVPPMFGFWAKLVVFDAAVAANLLPLAVIGIAASVIGAFYYLKVVKVMYFDPPADVIARGDDKALSLVSGTMALAVSPLGYFAIPMLGIVTAQAAKSLF